MNDACHSALQRPQRNLVAEPRQVKAGSSSQNRIVGFIAKLNPSAPRGNAAHDNSRADSRSREFIDCLRSDAMELGIPGYPQPLVLDPDSVAPQNFRCQTLLFPQHSQEQVL